MKYEIADSNTRVIWAFAYVTFLIAAALSMAPIGTLFALQLPYLQLYLVLPLAFLGVECMRQAFHKSSRWPVNLIVGLMPLSFLHLLVPLPSFWAQVILFVFNLLMWLAAYRLTLRLVASSK